MQTWYLQIVYILTIVLSLAKLVIHVSIASVSCFKQSPQIWMSGLVALNHKPHFQSDQLSAVGSNLQSFLVLLFHTHDRYDLSEGW